MSEMERWPGDKPKRQVKSSAVTKYWMDWYIVDGLCSLCGNSGMVDTRRTAISPRGIKTGRKQFCICPNGQQLRHVSREDKAK